MMRRVVRWLATPVRRRRERCEDAAAYFALHQLRYGAYPATVASDLDWPIERACEALRRLEHAGWVQRQSDGGRWRYNTVRGAR